MGDLEISHDMLLAGSDLESCRKRVQRFFDRTMLLRYDEVLIPEDEALNGTDEKFLSRLGEGLAANHQVMRELLDNLRDEGFATLEDIRNLKKGYISKIFHTVAHLLDGFIGIDSRFYNLEEDSHTISRELHRRILAAPDNFWILRVKGRIASAPEDPFDALRTFEWKGQG